MISNTLSQKERAVIEIDTRIHSLVLRLLATNGDLSTKEIVGYLRAAYTQGYIDCLKEPEGQRGVWIKDLGYGIKGIDI